MENQDKIDNYFSYFEGHIGKVLLIDNPLYQKIILVTILDTFARAVYPNKQDRFVKLIRNYANWKDCDRISLPQISYLLETSCDKPNDQLAKEVKLRFKGWQNGRLPRLDIDPWFHELESFAKDENEKGLIAHCRHAKLLYKYRNYLVHEFREPGYPMEISNDNTTPYYHGMLDSKNSHTWELVYPSGFFINVVKDSIANLKNYFQNNDLNPYESYQFGSNWNHSKVKKKLIMAKEIFNIASYLPQMAEKRPYKRAIVFPHGRDRQGRVAYTHLTFSQLNTESSRYAYGLDKLGIKKGCRVLLMVKPGLEFVGLTFALFRLGAVPILIDPGMGVSNLLNCIKEVEPEALIAIPIVHFVKTFKPAYFSTIKHCVTVGGNYFWEGATLEEIRENECGNFTPVKTRKDDPAAILFTTGSTGPPKGVLYQHGMFGAQVEHVKSRYGIDEDDVDMPAFPLFALFSAAIGMTCIIPDMDPTRPARVDPEKIIEAVENHGVTNSFGSPALWNRVGEYCLKHDIRLPSIKRILMAGAPVPGVVLENLKNILSPDADTFTPYGATESLPIASISGSERLADTEEKSKQGAGTCVGTPLEGITIKIIKITDEAISSWDENLVLNQGEKGEIVVCGDVVTHEYFHKKEETDRAKIPDGDTIWHRMGDIGYIDEQNRVWFCGRKAHRVITHNQILFSVPCEAIFNQHPKVFRSALVGIGAPNNKRPVIIIELRKKGRLKYFWEQRKLVKELLELGQEFEHTKGIEDVLFHPSFPVDIRHNVKISREKLAVWAEGKIK